MPVNSFEHYPMSWRPVLSKTSSPIYKELALQLEKDIKDKRLLPGTKLPPQRELADYLDINLSTVSRAFKICEQKGFICASVGSGTYVAADALTNTIILSHPEEHKMIEMGAILPDWRANHFLGEYMQKLCLESDFSKLFQYGTSKGTLFQRQAATEWMGKAKFYVNPEDIIFAAGGQNAITAILAGLFQPGDRVGTDPVTYPGIKTSAKMLGIQLIPIQQFQNEITEEGLQYACKTEKIKGLYIIPDYQNPTTHYMSLEKRKSIANIASKNKLIIIEDAINSLMSEDPLPPIATFAPNQTIYISSLSKIMAPGLRLSFVFVPEEYKKKVETALYNINVSVSPLMIELASRLITTDLWTNIAKERLAYIKQQNELVNRIFGKRGITKDKKEYRIEGDKCCPFRWISLPDTFTGKTFELYAKNAGIQLYSAERFAVGNAVVPRAVRIAITSVKEPSELERGLCILKEILDSEEDISFY